MRVLLATRVYPTQRAGGLPHVAHDRAVELARQGHDVHVVTTSLGPEAGRMYGISTKVEKGVTVHYTDSPAHDWTPAFAHRLTAKATELQPDVIHSESFDRASLWWRGLHNPPTIAITMHGLGFGGWLTEWNERRALGGKAVPFPYEALQAEAAGLATVDVVIGVSLWEQRILRDQYGIPDAKLVYNPIPAEFFQPPTHQPRRYFLCAAISSGPKRGFERAKEAARKAGVKLQTVSNVTRAQMPGFYDRAIAVVLPTAYCQGYDLTIAEGRARGCPAIMTPTGSYLDEAARWDRMVNLGDEAGLVAALKAPHMLVPDGAADRHRPSEHVRAWLDAVNLRP